jgi:hypothetical protein
MNRPQAHDCVTAIGDLVLRAHQLGTVHARAESQGRHHPPVYIGRDVAIALGVSESLDREHRDALNRAYQRGFADFGSTTGPKSEPDTRAS